MMEDASTPGGRARSKVWRVSSWGKRCRTPPSSSPALVMALVRTLRRARQDDRDLFLASFSWPVLLLVLTAMLRVKDAEQHWTMVAFIPAAIAAGRYADEAWTSTKRFSIVLPRPESSRASFGLRARDRPFPHRRLDAPAPPPPRTTTREPISRTRWPQLGPGPRVAQRESGGPHGARGNVVLASNHYAMCGRLLMEDGATHRTSIARRHGARRSTSSIGAIRPPSATVIAVTSDIHTRSPRRVSTGARASYRTTWSSSARGARQVAHYSVHSCPPVQTSSGEARVARLARPCSTAGRARARWGGLLPKRRPSSFVRDERLWLLGLAIVTLLFVGSLARHRLAEGGREATPPS